MRAEFITYSRIDTFAEALKGFDAEAGFLLPGELSERFDLRAFGGGYHYEGTNIPGFSGWSSRLQADIGGWLEVGLKVTDDKLFDTTVSFNCRGSSWRIQQSGTYEAFGHPAVS